MAYKKNSSLLLKLLADGKFHSGESIGTLLGVSRAAVWKQLKGVEKLGVKIVSVKGRGYRLESSMILLDQEQIIRDLHQYNLNTDVTVFDEIDSTNAELLRRLQSRGQAAESIVLAESQSAGRGRRGRHWVSPFGMNLNFSMSWSFHAGVASLDGMSLLVGLSVIQVLESFGLDRLQLKWPNDILVGNKKLAGILLEITGDPTGCGHVVIGIGIDVSTHNWSGAIDQPWIALDQLLAKPIDRNKLVVLLVSILVSNLKRFDSEGFTPFASQWQKYDAYLDQDVAIFFGDKSVFGIAKGVTASGELRLETEGGIRICNGGEVSLRRKL